MDRQFLIDVESFQNEDLIVDKTILNKQFYENLLHFPST